MKGTFKAVEFQRKVRAKLSREYTRDRKKFIKSLSKYAVKRQDRKAGQSVKLVNPTT